MSAYIILLATSALAADESEANPDVTIEAEFGAKIWLGSIYTAFHHQPVDDVQPAPCNNPLIPMLSEATIGVSHIDLDCVGGCARVMGRMELFDAEDLEEFWQLAAFIDTSGPHRISEFKDAEAAKDRIHAYWAWSQANRQWPPKGDVVVDVTDQVMEHLSILDRIFRGDPELLAAGQAFKDGEAELSSKSFVSFKDNIVVRRSGSFVNHLYEMPDGQIADAVVGFNVDTGAITISFADGGNGERSCRDIVQMLWGEEAGGNPGIGGGPRERVMTEQDFEDAVEAVRQALHG